MNPVITPSTHDWEQLRKYSISGSETIMVQYGGGYEKEKLAQFTPKWGIIPSTKSEIWRDEIIKTNLTHVGAILNLAEMHPTM